MFTHRASPNRRTGYRQEACDQRASLPIIEGSPGDGEDVHIAGRSCLASWRAAIGDSPQHKAIPFLLRLRLRD
jgi:hypothetical protein